MFFLNIAFDCFIVCFFRFLLYRVHLIEFLHEYVCQYRVWTKVLPSPHSWGVRWQKKLAGNYIKPDTSASLIFWKSTLRNPYFPAERTRCWTSMQLSRYLLWMNGLCRNCPKQMSSSSLNWRNAALTVRLLFSVRFINARTGSSGCEAGLMLSLS